MSHLPYTHVKVCRRASTNPKHFATFKQQPEFIKILEHVSPKTGRQYASLIKKRYPRILQKLNWESIQTNDKYGGASVCDYRDVFGKLPNTTHARFSPTTLRYAYQAIDALVKFPGKQLTIIEIGGGYGGLCKVIHDVAPVIGKEVTSYTLIDLPEPVSLQEKYLSHWELSDLKFISFSSNMTSRLDDKYDLLVSNYALGELNRWTQDIYADQVVKRCATYYVTWNTKDVHPIFATAKTLPEEPKTGRHNLLLTKFTCHV